jgi:hypothetical protein
MATLPYKWVLDLSHHNNLKRAQMVELVDRGMCGIIAKACQGDYATDRMIEEHLENASYLGIPYGIYGWPDPIPGIVSIPSQIEHLGKQIRKYNPKFVAWDAEQWWASWVEWNAKYVKKQNVHVKALSSGHLYSFYRSYNAELKRQLLDKYKNIPSVAYSAQWFTRSYCRQLATVFRDESPFYWTAYYFSWKDLNGDGFMDWKEWEHWMCNLVNPGPAGLPDGMSKWDIWQVGEITVKGFPRLDYNIITDAAYKALFGGKVPVIAKPVEPVQETITVSTGDNQLEISLAPSGLQFVTTAQPHLNVRSSPKVLTTNDIGDILPGTTITPLNIVGTDAWIEIGPGKFCCVQKGTTRFMEPKDEKDSEGHTPPSSTSPL